MAFEDRTNRLQYPVNAGSPTVFTLNPGGKILRGEVILTGTLVVSGGTTNGTTLGEGGPINLIQRIRITANRANGSRYPGGLLVDCHPRALLRYAMYEHQGKFIGEQNGSVIGNGAAGSYFIYLSIPIYWADATLLNEMMTALNADLVDSTGAPIYTAIQVEVDIAPNLAGCFLGNDRVINTAGLQIQWQDDRLGLASDTVPLVQEDHDMLIAVTQTRAQDFAMPQDGSFSSWLILAEQNTSRTLSDGLLNRVTLKAPTINLDQYAPYDLRQQMLSDGWLDPSQSGVGQFFIDFTHGLLQNGNPASGISAMFDVNNLSGANLDQLKFYTRRTYALLSN